MILNNILKKFDNAVYRINGGNLGDFAIEYANQQLFTKLGIHVRTANKTNKKQLVSTPYDLIYSGGGGWVGTYMKKHQVDVDMYFGNKNIRKCIIMPSTFYKCDDLVKMFDDRFIVFCRDKRSFDYCLSLNSKAKFYLYNDIVINCDISAINLDKPYINKSLIPAFNKLNEFLKTTKNNKTGYFIRKDVEKTIAGKYQNEFDISGLFSIHGESMSYDMAKSGIEIMLYGINKFDTIYTNRLHVCILANLLNKKIKLLNNSYGKCFDVYKTSFIDNKNIELIH